MLVRFIFIITFFLIFSLRVFAFSTGSQKTESCPQSAPTNQLYVDQLKKDKEDLQQKVNNLTNKSGSDGEINRLKKEKEDCLNENAGLQGQMLGKDAEISRLWQWNWDSVLKVNDLTKEVTDLQNEKANLISKKNELEVLAKELQTAKNHLEEEVILKNKDIQDQKTAIAVLEEQLKGEKSRVEEYLTRIEKLESGAGIVVSPAKLSDVGLYEVLTSGESKLSLSVRKLLYNNYQEEKFYKGCQVVDADCGEVASSTTYSIQTISTLLKRLVLPKKYSISYNHTFPIIQSIAIRLSTISRSNKGTKKIISLFNNYCSERRKEISNETKRGIQIIKSGHEANNNSTFSSTNLVNAASKVGKYGQQALTLMATPGGAVSQASLKAGLFKATGKLGSAFKNARFARKTLGKGYDNFYKSRSGWTQLGMLGGQKALKSVNIEVDKQDTWYGRLAGTFTGKTWDSISNTWKKIVKQDQANEILKYKGERYEVWAGASQTSFSNDHAKAWWNKFNDDHGINAENIDESLRNKFDEVLKMPPGPGRKEELVKVAKEVLEKRRNECNKSPSLSESCKESLDAISNTLGEVMEETHKKNNNNPEETKKEITKSSETVKNDPSTTKSFSNNKDPDQSFEDKLESKIILEKTAEKAAEKVFKKYLTGPGSLAEKQKKIAEELKNIKNEMKDLKGEMELLTSVVLMNATPSQRKKYYEGRLKDAESKGADADTIKNLKNLINTEQAKIDYQKELENFQKALATMNEAAKFFSTVFKLDPSFVSNVGKITNVMNSFHQIDINWSSTLNTAGKAPGLLGNFSANPNLYFAAANAVLSLFSSGGKDAATQRHEQVMEGIQKILEGVNELLKGQHEIKKSLAEIREEAFKYHKEEMEKLGLIHDDLLANLKLSNMIAQDEQYSCDSFFTAMSGPFSFNSNVGPHSYELVSQKGRNLTPLLESDIPSFSERRKRFNNQSHLFSTCIKGINDLFTSNKNELFKLKYSVDGGDSYTLTNFTDNCPIADGDTRSDRGKCLNDTYKNFIWPATINYFRNYRGSSFSSLQDNYVQDKNFHHQTFLSMMEPVYTVFETDLHYSVAPLVAKYYEVNGDINFFHSAKNLDDPLDFSKLKIATEYLLTILPYAELAVRDENNKYYIPNLNELVSHKKDNFDHNLRYSLDYSIKRLKIAVAQEVFISGPPLFEMMLNNLYPEFIEKSFNIFNNPQDDTDSGVEEDNENSDETPLYILSSTVEKIKGEGKGEEEEEDLPISYKTTLKLSKEIPFEDLKDVTLTFFGPNLLSPLFIKTNITLQKATDDPNSFEGEITFEDSISDNYSIDKVQKNSILVRWNFKDSEDNIHQSDLIAIKGSRISDLKNKFNLAETDTVTDENENGSTT